jgi:hypothetical protein
MIICVRENDHFALDIALDTFYIYLLLVRKDTNSPLSSIALNARGAFVAPFLWYYLLFQVGFSPVRAYDFDPPHTHGRKDIFVPNGLVIMTTSGYSIRSVGPW